mgnify:CR=1 FL=1
MILNAMESKPLPVYGDGLNVRDWIHVNDHCDAIYRAYEYGIPGEVYNIGSENECNNLHIVKSIVSILGKSEDLIQFVKDRPGHDQRYAIDARKAKIELGWMPRITFEQGLERTVDWYLENQEWVSKVTSGAYQTYYEQMYSNR